MIALLAVTVLSAINPVEQFNKARDTSSKQDASEYLSSLERYFATFGCYPWDNANNGTATNACPATPVGLSATAVGSLNATTNAELATRQEIKPQFKTRMATETVAANKNVLIASVDANNLVHVCYLPSSKSFLAQATGDASGGTGTTHVCVP